MWPTYWIKIEVGWTVYRYVSDKCTVIIWDLLKIVRYVREKRRL